MAQSVSSKQSVPVRYRFLQDVVVSPRSYVASVEGLKLSVIYTSELLSDIVPVITRLSEKSIMSAPEFSSIFPVVDVPSVSVCLLVVPIVPSPVKYKALLPEFAEIDAVGVPAAMFSTANLAEEVACPPTKKSTVELLGNKAPPD